MKVITKISLIIISLPIFVSCLKDNDFAEVPAIDFVEFVSFTNESDEVDSAKFVFNFQDGDGDLGSDNPLEINCYLIYEEKNGSSITTFPEIDDREYNLPNLTPNANDKNIEGEISLILKPAPIFNILTDSSYRYKCYVIDRAGNSSNVIYTDWINK